MNRLTTSYKIGGTSSFRLAASKMLGYYGTNLQNPSDSLMQCVVAPEGRKFLQPDQAGAEALVVAYECPAGKFRRLFQLGLKVHSYLALQIFTDHFCTGMKQPRERYSFVDPDILKSYPEVKELFTVIQDDSKKYDLGKRGIHANNYGMKWRTFQSTCLDISDGQTVLSPAESKHILNTTNLTFPEIMVGQSETVEKLKRGRTLCNLFGYPRTFYGIWTDGMLRDAYAFVPQSTVAVITHKAYTKMFHYIRKNRLPWQLLNNKHDSLLMEIPDTAEHTEHATKELRAAFEIELTSSHGEKYFMRSGISVGYNWGKHHKIKNPQGMKEQ